MPEPYIDEEIETRTLSLCLFDVAGITVLNRCANCPGAARASIQHRRCPKESLQPNIFRSEDPDIKIGAALKSLASSSRQHESEHHEAESVLPNGFANLSLVDSDGTAGTIGRSEPDPDIFSGRAELSGTPGIPRGVKRKAKLEHREGIWKSQFGHLSVQEYLESKPPTPFRDLEPGNLFMAGCLRVPEDEMSALMKNSTASPMDTQEAPPPRVYVPGCCINTKWGGFGLLPCDDGVESEGCEVLALNGNLEEP